VARRTICWALSVVLVLTLASCTSGGKYLIQVSGTLTSQGGPAPRKPGPLNGQIFVYAGTDTTARPAATVKTYATGHFRLALAPGRYSFWAQPSNWTPGLCGTRQAVALTVKPVHVEVDVVCYVL
jgi:hypothetical protein